MALGLLALPLALPLLGTSALPTAAASEEDEATWAVPVRVATYNFQGKRPLKKFKPAVDKLMERVEVAGLQETRQADRIKHLDRAPQWGVYRPGDTNPNPVIWDKRVFQFVQGRGFLLAHGRNIGNEREAGRGVYHDTYATVVRLRHLSTGANFSVINVHLVAGAVRKGRPWPGRPKLFRMYRQQLASVVKVERIESEWGKVFVLGDLNVGYRIDRATQRRGLPYQRLTRRGLTSMWRDHDLSTGGTRNRSYIDQIWSDRAATSAEVARDIRGSDHLPAIATYTYDLIPLTLAAP
ncbi:endonuclease/exonuclease/phosphatase family protein [Nocardioides sp.]|uniref:endonuclease/exonuclease/phosphatase family protein n=1 Tax=Nocardioides sp. TaxID=35761 RepID=UPI00356A69B9